MIVVLNNKSNLEKQEFINYLNNLKNVKTDNTLILCPTYLNIPLVDGILLGSQNVSKFDDGAYTGEISAVFYHVMPNMPRYKAGDKIAQLHLDLSNYLSFKEADELDKTDRGAGGYGSTGK